MEKNRNKAVRFGGRIVFIGHQKIEKDILQAKVSHQFLFSVIG